MSLPCDSSRTAAGLPDAIERYLHGMRRDGRSEATIRNYRADLWALAKTADFEVGPVRLPRLMRDHLNRLEIGKRSWNRHLSTLRGFCDYLVARGTLATNPFARVSARRVEQRSPSAVPKREIRRLFERIDRTRDRALIRLLWECGLRVGQALRLELGDVDLQARSIAIGDSDRKKPVKLSASAKLALAEYLRERGPAKTSFVFVANGGRPLSYAAAHRLFRLYAGTSGLTMQRLRAGAAMAAFVSGASIGQVQEMMGHQHIASTARYARTQDKEKVE